MKMSSKVIPNMKTNLRWLIQLQVWAPGSVKWDNNINNNHFICNASFKSNVTCVTLILT